MGKIKIVTDSTCDLSVAELEAAGVELVPVMINFEDGSYRELLDLSIEEFYRKMAAQEKLPTTAQPLPGDTLAAFQRLTEEGYQVISYHISSKLSGSVRTAERIARDFPAGQVTVVDSQSVSLGLGCMVETAAKARAKGLSKEEILKITDYISRHIVIYFVVDTLENLQKGGRIGKATAFLGGMLNIRPLLSLREGMVCPVERIRGKSRAVERMCQLIRREMTAHAGPGQLYLGHCGARKELESYLPEMLAALGVSREETKIKDIGAAIGTHAGAGLLAVAYMPCTDNILPVLRDEESGAGKEA